MDAPHHLDLFLSDEELALHALCVEVMRHLSRAEGAAAEARKACRRRDKTKGRRETRARLEELEAALAACRRAVQEAEARELGGHGGF